MPKALSIHIGKDEDGFYFAFVDTVTGLYQRIRLNKRQLALAARQAVTLALNELPDG